MLPEGKKINVFIIGAQKAGTTSLFHYMDQHPDICFSEIKELTYFYDNEYYERGESYLHSFFKNYNSQPVVASSFVHMISAPHCPERVQQYNPDMKIVVMLRHPVARAYSAYHYAKLRGRKVADTFREAILYEQQQYQNGLTIDVPDIKIIDNGLYYKHVARWLQYFDRKQILLVKSDDLRFHTEATMTKVFDFIGANPGYETDTSQEYNKAGVPRSEKVRDIMMSKGLKKFMGKVVPSQRLKILIRKKLLTRLWAMNTKPTKNVPITEEEQAFAAHYFTEDLALLQQHMGITFDQVPPSHHDSQAQMMNEDDGD